MQTFLPYPNYKESAKVLDWSRLGKQRSECVAIVRANIGHRKGWKHHPATLMWKGYEVELITYGLTICKEFIDRGYEDSTWITLNSLLPYATDGGKPPWFGNEDFHASHRAVLLDKDYDWYSQFGWKEERAKRNSKGSYPYVWPVRKKTV